MKRIAYRAGWMVALVAAATTSRAATFTWDGGGATNNWSDDFNWAGNVEPANDGTANIVFGATSKPDTVLNQNWNINSLQFDDAAPDMEINENQPTTLTIQASTGFGIGLTNFSSETHMIECNIALGGSQFWNNAAGLMGFFGTISLGGHSLFFAVNDNFVIVPGIITGSPSSELVKSGDGELILTGNEANIYSGTTTVNAGTLSLGKSIFGVPAVPGPLVIGDASGGFEADKVELQGNFQIDGDVTVNSSGLLDLNGHNEGIDDLTLNAGRIQTGSGTLTLSGQVASVAAPSSARITVDLLGTLSLGNASGSTTFEVADGTAADDLVIDGDISGGSNQHLSKTGAGRLVLTGAAPNTYSGTTFVTGGTLLLNKFNTDAAIQGDLIIGNNVGPTFAVVRLALNHQIMEGAGHEVRVRRFGFLNTDGFTDAIGPLVMEGGQVDSGNGVLTVGFGVSSKASSQTAIISGNLDLNGSVQTFDIEDGAPLIDVRLAADLLDGGVTKTGAGTLALQGSNTYAGPTVVNGGKLLVNNASGSGTGSGNVAVNALATLGGTGSIAGSVSVGASGILSPGLSVGDLQVGAVAFANTANLDIEIGGLTPGTQFDQLIVSGDAILNGSVTVALVGGFVPAAGDVFSVLTAGGDVTGQFTTTGANLPDLPGGLRWQIRYLPSSVDLGVLQPFEADFDEDGDVDGDDLVKWQSGYGTSAAATHMQGDADGDLDVDGADFFVWQKQLGSTSNEPASTAAPEPSSWLLCVLTCAAVSRRKRGAPPCRRRDF